MTLHRHGCTNLLTGATAFIAVFSLCRPHTAAPVFLMHFYHGEETPLLMLFSGSFFFYTKGRIQTFKHGMSLCDLTPIHISDFTFHLLPLFPPTAEVLFQFCRCSLHSLLCGHSLAFSPPVHPLTSKFIFPGDSLPNFSVFVYCFKETFPHIPPYSRKIWVVLLRCAPRVYWICSVIILRML